MFKLFFLLFLLLWVLGKVSEDVIQNKVAIGLLSKYKCLNKSFMRLALVGNLANDLDDNVRVRTLRVNVGDTDFGVVEVKLLDSIIDGLEGNVLIAAQT